MTWNQDVTMFLCQSWKITSSAETDDQMAGFIDKNARLKRVIVDQVYTTGTTNSNFQNFSLRLRSVSLIPGLTITGRISTQWKRPTVSLNQLQNLKTLNWKWVSLMVRDRSPTQREVTSGPFQKSCRKNFCHLQKVTCSTKSTDHRYTRFTPTFSRSRLWTQLKLIRVS